MDQDSFRQLLQSGPSGTSASRSATAPRGKPSKTKKAAANASQPAFKPRTVKKNEEQYRDRASERRHGKAHDFAQVEALAEDFEARNKDLDRDTVEQQRRFLGGDSEHTILVKGLDFALLEQSKARLAEASVDDDTLEQAFVEGTSNAPKKRTREDIVKELKNKRLKGGDDSSASAVVVDTPIDDVKKTGKFKPIGLKPIGASEGKKAKKVKEGMKKKKKIATTNVDAKLNDEIKSLDALVTTPAKPPLPAEPAPEPISDNDDIFAGAGEYTGIELGDDDDIDEDNDEPPKLAQNDAASDGEIPEPQPPRVRWIDIDHPTSAPPRKSLSPPLPTPKPPSAQPPRSASTTREHEMEEGEEEAPMRLQPLASSSVPSIRELLAIDEAEEKAEKRRARKEKKKEKATLSTEEKVSRDYQRLKAYTEKKSGGK
ncbi:hypothetical protein PHLGIDRAFT_268850 [Phlebiopsis gigantea 11061_1 CR5-6]|uniref:RED-like N-terminal domain-containing protein n=1 Tax=Phlebiopsis gigantea (strain 11061_1 CR5-6) TaxID=745531 RepID=A0A0C3S1A6_PHLG1|nr:hypothetical protein PHLGIDRAFT_268850 [Phlebiopsis gigantea 11061_1 CR5-6]